MANEDRKVTPAVQQITSDLSSPFETDPASIGLERIRARYLALAIEKLAQVRDAMRPVCFSLKASEPDSEGAKFVEDNYVNVCIAHQALTDLQQVADAQSQAMAVTTHELGKFKVRGGTS